MCICYPDVLYSSCVSHVGVTRYHRVWVTKVVFTCTDTGYNSQYFWSSAKQTQLVSFPVSCSSKMQTKILPFECTFDMKPSACSFVVFSPFKSSSVFLWRKRIHQRLHLSGVFFAFQVWRCYYFLSLYVRYFAFIHVFHTKKHPNAKHLHTCRDGVGLNRPPRKSILQVTTVTIVPRPIPHQLPVYGRKLKKIIFFIMTVMLLIFFLSVSPFYFLSHPNTEKKFKK